MKILIRVRPGQSWRANAIGYSQDDRETLTNYLFTALSGFTLDSFREYEENLFRHPKEHGFYFPFRDFNEALDEACKLFNWEIEYVEA